MRAEHSIKTSVHITLHIAELYAVMLKKCYISEVLQTGTMNTIPKKGKDPRLPSNYRGISLTPIMAKILEDILLARDERLILSKQSNMQMGFTASTSPAWGSLMFTEAISEATDKRQPLYAAALDTMKAFHTVWHESLLRKQYILGMDKHWSIRRKMIQNMVIRIRVGDELSRPVIIQQGVGQGRPWSSHDYKAMIDDIE